MFDEKITHARFTLPNPPADIGPGHPFKNDKMHERLLQYLRQRLESDKPNRDSRIQKYAQIDRDVSGWIRMSDEDKKRRDKHSRDGSPQATAINLPLTWVHLDDMMTYYAQTFAPNRGMFYHTSNPDDSNDARTLVQIMNNHAVYGGYYRQLLRSIFSIQKYNLGGLIVNWATDYGPTLQGDATGTGVAVAYEPVFRGNKINSVDMYNLYMDPSVEPSSLHREGEWFATVEMKSHYWLKSKCMERVFFNTGDVLDEETGPNGVEAKYYTDPPAYARISTDESAPESWFSILKGTDGFMTNGAFELVTIYIKINPNDFGLINGTREQKAARNRYETWRFTLLNDQRIIECTWMNNIHGYLPVFFGVTNDDIMGQAAKGPAEILNPLQEFSSFLLNAHILANRKNIYGTTFYDPTCINMDAVPEGEVAARVPIKPQGYGRDIRTMVMRDEHALDTKQTLGDLQGMIGIIDQFFPTQSLPSQIAGIDRAIDSQVAAVQQGSNRRQHKGARLLDDTMMRPLRFALYYNIVQFQADGDDIVDYFKGTSSKVDLSKLRATNLAYIIGQGLKAIDRQAVAQQLQQVFFAAIQAPGVAQQIDILKFLDFWTSMMDIDTSMEEFRPQQQLPAPGTPQAGEGAAPAGAPADTSVTPATNPASLTAPIYG